MKKRSLHYRCMQYGPDLLRGDRYRYIDNGSKILAVAHTDFVLGSGDRLKYRRKGDRVQCISLDDRLGVHIILDLLPGLGIRTDVLLTDDEEIGQSTAAYFNPPKDYNWIFSFDRRGTGAVVYDYTEMQSTARDYFGKVHPGAFSDISFMEHLGCAGINIGTGYYSEHSMACNANLAIMRQQVERFACMYHDLKDSWIPHDIPVELIAEEADDDDDDDEVVYGHPTDDDPFGEEPDPQSLRWILEEQLKNTTPRILD